MSGLAGFRAQVVELLPRLRRMARALTRGHADADDLVQLTVERALLRWQQWQPGSRLDSWMFGVMKNAWIDEVRAQRRRGRVFVAEEEGEQVGDQSAEQQHQAMAIKQAMERLPDEQRLAVALVLVEGLSYKEAAAVMDVPMGTLTSRLARAREALMSTLGDGGQSTVGVDHGNQ
jgi:RNA polymerase sigma-70 factor (ECF subfamily)